MKLEKIYFKATDGLELYGLLHLPDNKTSRVVISTHGITSNLFRKREDVIAQEVTKSGIAYLSYNNRGHDLVSTSNRNQEKILGGSVYEDVLDSYYDVKGAISFAKSLGFQEIILQGHSLGCTKTVYTYHKMIERKDEEISLIKAIILLSPVDIPAVLKFSLGKSFNRAIHYAISQKKKRKELSLMPEGSFICPISVKSFLRYSVDNHEIDFFKYGEKENKLEILNEIKVPLMIRWGNQNELILQNAEILSKELVDKIQNEKKDIGYIDGATHNYAGKEEELAKQIKEFVEKIEIKR